MIGATIDPAVTAVQQDACPFANLARLGRQNGLLPWFRFMAFIPVRQVDLPFSRRNEVEERRDSFGSRNTLLARLASK